MTFFGYRQVRFSLIESGAVKGTKKMAFSWMGGRVGPCPSPGSQVQLNIQTLMTACLMSCWLADAQKDRGSQEMQPASRTASSICSSVGGFPTPHVVVHTAIQKLFSLVPQVITWVRRSETHIGSCRRLPGCKPQSPGASIYCNSSIAWLPSFLREVCQL